VHKSSKYSEIKITPPILFDLSETEEICFNLQHIGLPAFTSA